MSVTWLFPYILILGLTGVVSFALTSQGLVRRLIEMGLFPQYLRGMMPIVNNIVRWIGLLLIICGLTKLAVDAGWLDSAILRRYGFAIFLILMGAGFLTLSWKNQQNTRQR